MPEVLVKRLGYVEYTKTKLPAGIKGKTQVGDLDAPLFISELLVPGADLEHIVAHEAGHRLTVEMALVAVSADASMLRASNSISQTLTHFFIASGLKESELHILHPEVKANLHKIFEDNHANRFTEEMLAREFVAEVFAGWATGRSKVSKRIEAMFDEIVTAKMEGELPPLVSVDSAAFAIVHPEAMPGWYDPRKDS